jgi:hypothetical protein
MIMTDKDGNTWRKICPSATLSTTHPIWTTLGSKPPQESMGLPGLCNDRPVTILPYTISGTTMK